jgi:hypothetical protein
MKNKMRIYSVELEHMHDHSMPESKYVYGSPVISFTRTMKEAVKIRNQKKREGMICKVYPIDVGRNKDSLIAILKDYAT